MTDNEKIDAMREDQWEKYKTNIGIPPVGRKKLGDKYVNRCTARIWLIPNIYFSGLWGLYRDRGDFPNIQNTLNTHLQAFQVF